MIRPFQLTTLALSACLLTACGGGGGGADPSTGGTDTGDNTVNPPPAAAVLATSTETLTLATSGTARRITVSNPGGLPVLALQATTIGFPAGTSLDSNCPTDLPGGASCDLLITPGGTPSATPGDLAPVAATISVSSTNTPAIDVSVSVLAYGSVHQGGYVFALDDSTPTTGGVGGKVLSSVDTAAAVWSISSGVVSGVSDDSLAGTGSCRGAVDGSCNTALILARFPSGSREFAAAQCADSRQEGFANWYLPALCEMGYNADGIVSGVCGTQAAPLVPDNARSRLFDGALRDRFGSAYWTSTQASVAPATEAHQAMFQITGTASELVKRSTTLPSKCARTFAP